jgi:hypothetical protein
VIALKKAVVVSMSALQVPGSIVDGTAKRLVTVPEEHFETLSGCCPPGEHTGGGAG